MLHFQTFDNPGLNDSFTNCNFYSLDQKVAEKDCAKIKIQFQTLINCTGINKNKHPNQSPSQRRERHKEHLIRRKCGYVQMPREKNKIKRQKQYLHMNHSNLCSRIGARKHTCLEVTFFLNNYNMPHNTNTQVISEQQNN